MSTFTRDPETGRTTVTVTVDDHGRVRDTDGPRQSLGNLEYDVANLSDALQTIATYINWTRTHQQDAYRDLLVNNIPEHMLEALAHAGGIAREVEALSLWCDAQEEEPTEDA